MRVERYFVCSALVFRNGRDLNNLSELLDSYTWGVISVEQKYPEGLPQIMQGNVSLETQHGAL